MRRIKPVLAHKAVLVVHLGGNVRNVQARRIRSQEAVRVGQAGYLFPEALFDFQFFYNRFQDDIHIGCGKAGIVTAEADPLYQGCRVVCRDQTGLDQRFLIEGDEMLAPVQKLLSQIIQYYVIACFCIYLSQRGSHYAGTGNDCFFCHCILSPLLTLVAAFRNLPYLCPSCAGFPVLRQVSQFHNRDREGS